MVKHLHLKPVEKKSAAYDTRYPLGTGRKLNVHKTLRRRPQAGIYQLGDLSWKKSTSINVSYTTNKRKPSQGKVSAFFRLNTFKTAF